MISLTRAPGRQQTSLRGGSVRHIGPSVPFRRESTTTITHLLFLVEVVLIQEVRSSDLGDDTSGVDGLSSPSSIAWPSTSRASYLLYRGTWGGEVGKEGLRLPPRAWTCLHSLFSFELLPSARWGGYRIPLIVGSYWWLLLLLFLSRGGQSMAPPVDLFLSLPDAP